MSEPLTEYLRLAGKASFHYADDSGDEWHLGNTAKHKALAIFDAHPELHSKMRANRELWSLGKERPDLDGAAK